MHQTKVTPTYLEREHLSPLTKHDKERTQKRQENAYSMLNGLYCHLERQKEGFEDPRDSLVEQWNGLSQIADG